MNIKQDDVRRWRLEIEQAIDFRDEQFGSFEPDNKKGVGHNLDYYEVGMSEESPRDWTLQPFTTLNLIFPIVKNIIPTLYYKNPKVIALPKRKEDEDSAPLAAEILNYYHRELNLKEVNQRVVFDAYVLGMGVCKIGYATQFGADTKDEEERKRKEKSKLNKMMETLGLKKPKPEEPKRENPEMNEFIRTESPYVIWVSPFDFLIDPRANSIHDAQWVAHRVRRTLKDIKGNPNYHNTKDLKPSTIEKTGVMKELSQSNLENFQTIDLYEIHYKTEEGINILTLAKDQEDYKALRHEKSVYNMSGFQFEVLHFNKHGHKLYPQSEVTLIRTLQDRISTAFDSIMDQVDRFDTKIIADKNAFSQDGRDALENGELGAVCWSEKNPSECVKELSLTQVKGDMLAMIEKIIDIMTIKTGLTRAQLTGITSAETATEAQIGQAGQNLRRSAQGDDVQDFVNKQSRKLWQVITDFVDLEELQIITGEPMTGPTGQIQYSWLQIDESMKGKLITGSYMFDIEVGSAQKPDVQVIRQQVQNLSNQLFLPIVDQQLVAEGTKLNHTELVRANLKLYPEAFKNIEKIIQQATQQQQQSQQMMMRQQAMGARGGENRGVIPNAQRRPPTPTTIQEEVMGEQMGGAG